jgi:hypothetical protein
MRGEAIGILLAILVAAGLGVGYLAGNETRRTETVTITSTAPCPSSTACGTFTYTPNGPVASGFSPGDDNIPLGQQCRTRECRVRRHCREYWQLTDSVSILRTQLLNRQEFHNTQGGLQLWPQRFFRCHPKSRPELFPIRSAWRRRLLLRTPPGGNGRCDFQLQLDS